MKSEIQIDSPCSEYWDKMDGGDVIRHCSKCQFNVYNFAEMTHMSGFSFNRA